MQGFKVVSKSKKLFNDNWWSTTEKQWVPILQSQNKKNWNAQLGPDKRPWKALTKKYSTWKMAHYGSLPILRLTGEMLDTAQIKSWGDSIRVSTSSVGPYHQFGTRNMVARPWVGIPAESMVSLLKISIKNILK